MHSVPTEGARETNGKLDLQKMEVLHRRFDVVQEKANMRPPQDVAAGVAQQGALES